MLVTGRPGFIGTYPTDFDDFLWGVVETQSGYLAFGGEGSSAGYGSRLLQIDLQGICFVDSLPQGGFYCACSGTDGSVVSAMAASAGMVLRETSVTGSVIWEAVFPQFIQMNHREIIRTQSGGYVIASEAPAPLKAGSWVMKTDSCGGFLWELTIQDANPTAISEMNNGLLILSCLNSSGSEIYLISPEGQLTGQLSFEGILVRDVASVNDQIAIAAVESGIFLFDLAGSEIWHFQPSMNGEIYSVATTENGDIAGAGSVLNGSELRSYLVRLDSEGFPAWERYFGYGESFRSIFLLSCGDNGFCSAGGYIENGTFNSFIVRTDSLGYTEQQGIETVETVESRVLLPNPHRGSPFSFTLLPCNESITLSLRNISGRTVFCRSYNPCSSSRNVSVNCLPSGVYLLTVEADNTMSSMQVTIFR